MKGIWTGLLCLLFTYTSAAQFSQEEKGFKVGNLGILPVLESEATYDDRAQISVDGDAEDDFYSDTSAEILLSNGEARFDLTGRGRYGYRFYDKLTDRNDDYYTVGGGISSDENAFQLGLSSYLSKSLDYSTQVERAQESGLGSRLFRDETTLVTTRANVGYEKKLTDKTSVKPTYEYWHYQQEFLRNVTNGTGTATNTVTTDAEWQVHRTGLELGYALSEQMQFFLSGNYSVHINEDETGQVGSVMVGARSQVTEKINWEAQVGAAAADYEESGTGQSIVSRVRGTWQASEKVSAYIFGGNDFQPGFGGGSARLVYRLGYGADWRITTRWKCGFRILHDQEESIEDAASSDNEDVRHFVSAQTSYDLTKYLALALSGRYINDRLAADQSIISLRATASF